MSQTVITKVLNQKIFFELCRFGMVGGMAAIVNLIGVIFFVETFSLDPLLANVFAFCIAFFVSFFGHRLWSFKAHDTVIKKSLVKFLCVAIAGFLMSEALYFIFYKIIKLHYIPALILVLFIVPPITFLLSKFWAFSK